VILVPTLGDALGSIKLPVKVPKTRYARNGDLHIAYQVIGDGPMDLVVVPGWVSNVEWFWESPFWAEVFDRFSSFARVILWDKRGTGLSDPVEGLPTLDERVDDLEAVMEAAGSQRAALFGFSEGGPMALLLAATRPERVSALVLYGTSPRFLAAPDWDYGWTSEEWQKLVLDMEQNWGGGALLQIFGPSVADNELARELFGRFQRMSASPAMARAVLEAAHELDCRDILSAVRVPTLVLHRTGDLVAQIGGGRYIAEHVPGARFVEFPGDDHTISLGADPGPIIDEMERFLTGTLRPHDTDRVLSTILFTDIVDSTRRASELGDRVWRTLLDRHDEVVRRQLERFRGREVKTVGDGFVATFDGPARAVRCAFAISDAVRRLGLEVRAGLHTGEVELRGNDVAGMAVHIGARVAALAQPGEVLVSGAVPPWWWAPDSGSPTGPLAN